MYIASPKNAYDAFDCLSGAESGFAENSSFFYMAFNKLDSFYKAGSSCYYPPDTF